ncbi:hypothetical protein PV387_41195 [Streptomyces sp. ME02-6987-2C]|uniref:hypothetical protein n=1 Tax=unclassified Streptomyces TaxID=2593676 RepID=UPI0029AB07BA|nr:MULTISPECIES: hypothetical protein [unclassified Streptomyces]MDX3345927.1 hypothetical protein [Streptomyces sp. ME02-6979A]MDX3372316.1 hypothetical protein [Streptomyces sp. ME02-6987-2C]MDX3412442.1 hypothetical protein [Streptomyces sp. ME02-6977A]MDX3421693.1 hypothetical protein [Streptomyces sp. ME02-6985-2c]
MSANLTEAEISAIFTAAATATKWRRVAGELRTEVPYGGFNWEVALPPESGRAFIGGTTGYGGDTCEYIEATWRETFPIVEAAMNATRAL